MVYRRRGGDGWGDGWGRRESIARGVMCTVLRRGKEGEKRRNEVGDEEFVTCCNSLNLINTR